VRRDLLGVAGGQGWPPPAYDRMAMEMDAGRAMRFAGRGCMPHDRQPEEA